jgi:ribosomal protein S18 acetylase RimI-like enzyme
MQQRLSADGYRIEDARSEDRDAVVDLFIEDLVELRAFVGERADLGAVYEALISEPRAIVLVVREPVRGEAVGVLVASLLLSVKFAGRSLWIEELYVGARARRRGLGRLLVDTLLERARSLGVNGIDLEAYQGNAPAGILYRSLGFRRLGRERFHYRFDWEDEGDR